MERVCATQMNLALLLIRYVVFLLVIKVTFLVIVLRQMFQAAEIQFVGIFLNGQTRLSLNRRKRIWIAATQ